MNTVVSLCFVKLKILMAKCAIGILLKIDKIFVLGKSGLDTRQMID